MRIDSTTRIGLPTESNTVIRTRPRGQDYVGLSLPDDSEKINRLAAAVSAGSYRVSPMQIAASIIHEMSQAVS